METGSVEMPAARTRPSRLIAEALVLKQNCAEIEERAYEMGLSEPLTKTVLSVCCRNRAPIHKYEKLTSQH